jgi:excisionase family DNA binding protein
MEVQKGRSTRPNEFKRQGSEPGTADARKCQHEKRSERTLLRLANWRTWRLKEGELDPEAMNEWLTSREAAEYLKIKPRTLGVWARQGKVPAHKLSGLHRCIGTLSEYPSKSAARRAAQCIPLPSPQPQQKQAMTLIGLVERYRVERMPKRSDTRRAYEVWISNHILPEWGGCEIVTLQPRPVELWLDSLPLAPKSKTHIRGLLRGLWDFAAWSGYVPREQRNPMELVRVRGATKRTRKPRSLTVEEFQKFVLNCPSLNLI